MGHYDDERAEEAGRAAEPVIAPADMTPAEALGLIRARCPAREWNVVLGSEIYQYSPRGVGTEWEGEVKGPALRCSVSVWRREDVQNGFRGEGGSLREAVEQVLALLPVVRGHVGCDLQLLSLEGVTVR
jgi:hypothetical protein